MEKASANIQPGLVSITFRAHSPERIADLAVANGLRGIEWGGDIHVPHGDRAAAAKVRQITMDAGLEIAAYGSYFRAGDRRGSAVRFDAVLESAVALGAPVVRIWAGVRGSELCDPDERERVVEAICSAAQAAAKEGIGIALEFHGGTLTDCRASAVDLLRQLPENVSSYWQPRTEAAPAERMADLNAVAPWLSHLHVFAWQAGERGTVRHPLQTAADEWAGYFDRARELGGKRFAMLEFVASDDPENLAADARTLRNLLSA